MKYTEYLEKIFDACIINVEETWSSYLSPSYKVELKILGLEPSVVEDYEITWDNVSEILNLEVERRHVVTGKGRMLSQWVYDVIDGTIEPTVDAGQTELVNQLIEFIKNKTERSGNDDNANKHQKNNASFTRRVNYAKKELKN